MYVYLLQSLNNPKHTYIGLTSDLKKRLTAHNNGQSKHTAKYRPWKIKAAVWLEDDEKALALEKYFKSSSGRAWIKKHIA
jgi:predicted GIY-YIG superfamily endonuclease